MDERELSATKEENADGNKKKKSKRIWTAVLTVVCFLALLTGAFFGGYFTYSSKIDDEIKSLLWVKETVQKEYKYGISDEEFYDAVFDGVNGMLDPYSQYLSAEDYAQTLVESTGRWSGVGLQFSTVDKNGDERLTVVRVSGNSPAYRAGVEEGSEIVAYGKNGEELSRVSTYDAFRLFLQEREENEPFVLRMKEGVSGEEKNYILQKEAFVESYVSYRSATTAYTYTGKDGNDRTADERTLPALGADTAYISLSQFNGGAAKQFDDAMSVFKAENKKHLVLDLRFNGGGYMNILCSIAKYFCKGGQGANPVVTRAVYKNGKVVEFRADGNVFYDYFTSESKIAVLADSGTASASECLIGCMVDYGAVGFENIYLSERVAQKTENGVLKTYTQYKTYGKGIMQSYFSRDLFSVSETLKLTTAEVQWPVSGKCIHGIGVTQADGAKTVVENFLADGEIQAAISDFLQNG